MTGRAPGKQPMNIQNPEAKEKLLVRLRRVEGQVRGVQNMIHEERDCRDVLQQLSAVRSAVQSISRLFLEEYAATCLAAMDDADPTLRAQRRQMMQDMIDLLDQAS